ncbi:MAG: tetratricopeptide repeat protein [Proteobacteria bacterium]|nr:tetratricopeptide repeat protein [Burkholderiales bacterium]
MTQAAGNSVRNVAAATRLQRLVDRHGDAGSLAEGALLIAQEVYPEIDIDHYLARLDMLGTILKARLPNAAGNVERILALNRFLFVEHEFAPDSDDFTDPRNSFLNEVLDRKRGIPITLSIVYIEVGRRIGLPLDGLSFPQHFLVRCTLPDGVAVIDPFQSGASLSIEELQRRLGALRQGHRPSRAEVSALLVAASRREILSRVLRNLKAVYLEREQFDHALVAADRILMLTPNVATEIRDRGWLYRRLDCFAAALADYRRYLELAPLAPDADDAREALIELERLAARLN